MKPGPALQAVFDELEDGEWKPLNRVVAVAMRKVSAQQAVRHLKAKNLSSTHVTDPVVAGQRAIVKRLIRDGVNRGSLEIEDDRVRRLK